jgi:hypothetical protein
MHYERKTSLLGGFISLFAHKGLTWPCGLSKSHLDKIGCMLRSGRSDDMSASVEQSLFVDPWMTVVHSMRSSNDLQAKGPNLVHDYTQGDNVPQLFQGLASTHRA